MSNSVIICIGTIESPTFARCKKHVDVIARQNKLVERVVVISGVRPQSAWLNRMRYESRDAKWCLQVDEDMYLKPNALTRLLSFALEVESSGRKILNCSSMLYDIFLEQPVGSLKLWSVEPLQRLEFNNILGGDRDYAKRAKKLGYSNFSIDEILGEHDSAPSPHIAFSKYYEYTQKIRKFKGEASAKKFSVFLKNKWKKDGCYISKKAYDGSKFGLSDPLKDKTKG